MNIRVVYDRNNEELSCVASLLKRHSGTYAVSDSDADAVVEFSIDKALADGSYAIKKTGDAHFTVSGGDRTGLTAGLGRLLHRGIELADDEVCVPDKKIRGIYFATHFHNYYQSAPIEKVTDYLEELAFWGCNSIAMWFDMHHFSGISDPEAEALLSRMHEIAKTAKKLGQKVLLGMLANEYYHGAPTELLAENSTDGTGYFANLCGFYNTELCPSKPQAKELLLRSHREILEWFSDVGLDYVWLWPYDQGGCTCRDCRPWGSNGFIDLACALSKTVKEIFPDAERAISTWRFDAFTKGEWNGFISRLDKIKDSFEYAVADFQGRIPGGFRKEAEKRGLRLFGFPEISMLSATPWGGFGGVPIPSRLYDEYVGTKDHHSGGFAYSEGIFEDINKAVMLGLYSGNSDKDSSVADYFRFYFGEASCKFAKEFTDCLESTLPRHRIGADGKADDYPRDDHITEMPTFLLRCPQKAARAYELAVQIKNSVSDEVARSDRFRMLYLRAVIDNELSVSGGKLTPVTEKAAKELEEMFYAKNADYAVCPITEKAIRENRGHI